jgi:hypothetical protein
MSKIIFDEERCRQELKTLLGKKRTITHVAVNRRTSRIDKDFFSLTINLKGLAGDIALDTHLASTDLPETTPLFTSNKPVYLVRFVTDFNYRSKLIFDAFDAHLTTWHLEVACQTENDLKYLNLTGITSRQELAERTLFLYVFSPPGALITYQSMTEAVTLRALLPEADLLKLWADVTREETWRDRPSLLI